MSNLKILITCPPMLKSMDRLQNIFDAKNIQTTCPQVLQTLSEKELIKLVPEHDGWIIGDDPATYNVFKAGVSGKLKAAVKWGIGIDNVDFQAAKEFSVPITNTPQMFGNEVADVATAYVLSLARKLFEIDRGVRENNWPKPAGESLTDKVAAVVGYGDIGSQTAKRLLACGMKVHVYDPFYSPKLGLDVINLSWPQEIEKADYIVFTCSLNKTNHHMLSQETLRKTKQGVKIVNVARGPLIDEIALIESLNSKQVSACALDVFELEPLPSNSPLRNHPACIFGSHNGSNTQEAVLKTSIRAIDLLFGYLGV